MFRNRRELLPSGNAYWVINNHTALIPSPSIVELLAHGARGRWWASSSRTWTCAARMWTKIRLRRSPPRAADLQPLRRDAPPKRRKWLAEHRYAGVLTCRNAGVRFYTYTATMGYCLEEAAKRKIAFLSAGSPQSVHRKAKSSKARCWTPTKPLFVACYPRPPSATAYLGDWRNCTTRKPTSTRACSNCDEKLARIINFTFPN